MKDVTDEICEITRRLHDSFWGSVEITFANGTVKAAKITETLQINRTPRNTRGTNEDITQRQ